MMCALEKKTKKSIQHRRSKMVGQPASRSRVLRLLLLLLAKAVGPAVCAGGGGARETVLDLGGAAWRVSSGNGSVRAAARSDPLHPTSWLANYFVCPKFGHAVMPCTREP